MSRWGATPEEWANFDFHLDLTDDLLPCVSNPEAKCHPESKLKAVGKTPSRYDNERFVWGIGDWTRKFSSPAQVAHWSKEADYGICLQTRRVRALDIDIDDRELAGRVAARFCQLVGLTPPARARANSGKQLLAFRVGMAAGGAVGGAAAGGEPFPKRSFRVDGGLVELLGDGQQFIAAGTHPSGVRYEWIGGLPDDFPEIAAEVFEPAWRALVDEFATAPAHEGNVRQKGAPIAADDPVAAWLSDRGLVSGFGRDGALYVECPWKHEHTSDSGVTEAAWFPAGTNGYERGGFRCLHAHCDGRGAAEFEQAVGYAADDFEELPDVETVAGGDDRDGGERPVGAGDSGGSGPVQVFDRGDLTLIALAALRRLWRRGERYTLIRASGAWYEWDGRRYEEVDEEVVRSALWRYLSTLYTFDKKGNQIKLAPTRDYVGNVADAMRALAERRGAEPPCWLDNGGGRDPRGLIPLADGVLDVSTRELIPHTPALFTLNALPYSWAGSEGEPVEWLAFLERIWPGDTEAQETLQEVFGYLLTPDTSQQKMFMLTGPKRSGKGTIGRVLNALVGQHNVSAVSLSSLAGEFGLENSIGKLVAYIGDARLEGVGNVSSMVEKLLNISGEDLMSVNRKNKTFWTGRATARVFMCANYPPKLGDASGALPGRFIHFETEESFFGREDRGLEGRLLKELPAIFRWALDGRDRLAERGYFRQPFSGEGAAREMEEMASPVGQFVAECCEAAADGYELVEDLFEAWRGWCGHKGHHAGAESTFGRALKAAAPKVRKARLRAEDRKAAYTGITLLEAARKRFVFGGVE